MGNQSASAALDIVLVMLEYASSLGMDIDAIRRQVGLNSDLFPNAEARMPLNQVELLWREIGCRSGDPYFGLHFGEDFGRLSTGGILFAVMMNCADTRMAMEKIARYHNLMIDGVHLHIEVEQESNHYIVETAGGAVLDRHFIEAVFSRLTYFLTQLTMGKVRPAGMHYTHPRPANPDEYQRILGLMPHFGSPRNEITLKREDLDQPIFMASTHALAFLETFLQENGARLDHSESWSERAMRTIKGCFTRGEKPTLGNLARQLSFSARQLQNKFKQEGSTYQVLLDKARKEAALEYFLEPRLSMIDIAFLLGFSDQSAFNHAFKRWTGETPGNYRDSGS